MGIRTSITNVYASLFDKSMSLLGDINRNHARKFFASMADFTITQQTHHGPIHFKCSNKVTEWRAQTLLEKEPETIAWIDTFNQGDIFWDVGANVGCYTLYAAKSGIQTLAFEPASGNYALLNENIDQNRLDSKASAYCLAFSNANGISTLNMHSISPGGALSQFGEATDTIPDIDRQRDVAFHQGGIGMTIDSFMALYNPSFPTHLKIDVDGIEDLILEGAQKTLTDKRLQSVLIEIDTANTPMAEKILGILNEAGLKLSTKAHGELFEESKYVSLFNHIFTRSAD